MIVSTLVKLILICC